jgi:hypothetical protein
MRRIQRASQLRKDVRIAEVRRTTLGNELRQAAAQAAR